MPDTDTLIRETAGPVSDGATSSPLAEAGRANSWAAQAARSRVTAPQPVRRPSHRQAAWREVGRRRTAVVGLVATTLVAIGALTAAGSVAGDQLPGALARAEAKVQSGLVFESLVRALLDSRAEAAEAKGPAAPAPKVLPHGKGMWMWQVGQTEGGNVDAMIARARAAGLSHIYVRTGSEPDGFYAGAFLNQILPAAHKAGIRIYGWDFPHLTDPGVDVHRAVAAITHTTPDGHRMDGFSADIETHSEGTHITAEGARAYGQALRQAVGPDYTLIATVPRPSPQRASFPYAEVVAQFDAVAPMVYWLNRQPGSDVAGAIRDLAPLGKPVFPVGQAYDGAAEGGRPGVPPPAELNQFMQTAHDSGASGVSFWSWQAADQAAWDTVKDARLFDR